VTAKPAPAGQKGDEAKPAEEEAKGDAKGSQAKQDQ
jgi:hypothetical protein